jgi:Protein of unknown function (DUF4238)
VTQYPNVKNAHIVPGTYLENWAVDGKIAVWLVPEGKRLDDQPVKNVGTRRRYYQRERPDGSYINDIEWTLGQIESNAAPLLRSFDKDWPLSGDDRMKLAVLFAFQLLRGPRWMEAYEARTRRFLEEYKRSKPVDLSPAELEEHDAQILSDTQRLGMMLSTAVTLSMIFASMHWTLVRFHAPLLATSDHPLVLWVGAASRSPSTSEITQLGVLECIEIRLPLSPTCAVLMTWVEYPEDEHASVSGTRDHAANLNAFTVVSADRQWFHRPGRAPPRASGNLRPLSLQLVPGYTAAAAAASRRRKQVAEFAEKRAGKDFRDREVDIVTVSRPRPPS